MLVSSTSFMIGMHICMGEVQHMALFSKAEGCENEQKLPPCHRHLTAPCCEDETVLHEADDLNSGTVHFHIDGTSGAEVAQGLALISELIPALPLLQSQYYQYDPPLRSCDLTVEHQVFLI
jgi:hypothetical protein